MDKYIYDKNNGLWYERCGDYYLPCLTLPEQKSVGKWEQKYRAYLRKHKREVYFCGPKCRLQTSVPSSIFSRTQSH